MKYVLAVVVIALGGLVVATVLGEQPSEDSNSSGTQAKGPKVDEKPAPVKSAGSGGTSSADYGARYKPVKDVLKDGVEAILTDLASGEASEADRVDLERRLMLFMEEEKLGDGFSRGETARMTIDFILKQVAKSGPKKGERRPVTDSQRMYIAKFAEQVALDIRRREAPGAAKGGKKHTGIMTAAPVEFDVPPGHLKLRWDVLGGFEFKDHMKLPDSVTSLNGKKVGVAGYMITLGEVEDIREFLLVEAGWSCCFGLPPDVNQVIEVRIPEGKPGVEFTTTPVAVIGTLDVGEQVEDGFVISVYRIEASEVKDVE